MRSVSIEERAVELAQYIIDSKDTVRGATSSCPIPKSIEIKGVFLSRKNPVVKLGLLIK